MYLIQFNLILSLVEVEHIAIVARFSYCITGILIYSPQHIKKLVYPIIILKGYAAYFFKKNILWMKTIHYPNTLRSHLVTIVPMARFTPKSTLKLRSVPH